MQYEPRTDLSRSYPNQVRAGISPARLSERLTEEIKMIDEEDEEEAEARAIEFNEILKQLPPAARL
jgi:hypothetical protein